MTAQTKAANKLKFETNDVPTQADFADLVDSYLDVVPTGVLYSSTTGRELQRLGAIGHIANWCTWDNAWLNGATDVTAALNAACTAIRSTGISASHRPVLILPPGKYLISDTIDCNKISVIAPYGAEILAQTVGTGKAALKWTQGAEDQWLDSNLPALQNVVIWGRNTPVSAPTFTTGAYAIQTGAPLLTFDHVLCFNFDNPVLWGVYDYIHTWRHCTFQACNYGVRWPKVWSVSGERMLFIDCCIANNNHGVYINHNLDTNADGLGDGASGGGSFYFESCSIDYNITDQITIVGPGAQNADHNGTTTFLGCHIENQISTGGSTNRIINGGVLHMDGTTIYDDYTVPITTSFYGRTNLTDVHFAIPGNNVWCTGNGNYRANSCSQRYGGDVLIHASIVDPMYQKNTQVVVSNVVDSTGANTITDVTGLSWAVTSGLTYTFRAVLTYTAAATTTGGIFTIGGVAMTYVCYKTDQTATATTEFTGTQVGINLPAAAPATSLTAGNIAVVEGIFKPSANGTAAVRFATEVDTSAITILPGSYVEWRRML